MGFEREMIRIKRYIPADRLTAMFSATWPLSVQDLARLYFRHEPIMINVGQLSHLPTANKSITQHIEQLATFEMKSKRLTELLNEFNEKDKILIFSNRKVTTEKIGSYLYKSGYRCGKLSSDSSQALREKVLFQFKKGQISVLVATDVASRGLDIPDVEAVINFDFPQTIESYVHRIGRTGRAGRTGLSYTFVDMSDTPKIMQELVSVLETSGQNIPDYLLNYNFNSRNRPYRGRFQKSRSQNNYQSSYKQRYDRQPTNRHNPPNENRAAQLISELQNDPKTLEAVKNLIDKLKN